MLKNYNYKVGEYIYAKKAVAFKSKMVVIIDHEEVFFQSQRRLNCKNLDKQRMKREIKNTVFT